MRNSGGDEMLFEPLPITGAVLAKIQSHPDERGFFARIFCSREFAAHGMPESFVQASVSYNEVRGTLRGMHFAWPHSREDKLVRCIRGGVIDVLLDLRPDSRSYLRYHAVELDAEARNAVFIPHGVAHGFQTLADKSEVLYQMTDFFAPDLGSGVRWNDPAFGIRWPLPPTMISERDATYPDFNQEAYEAELSARQRVPVTS